jgi:alpha-2-macroglobulin-like protein
MDVSITSDYKSYSPADTATIKVQTNLSNGKKVSAVLGVTVTDESVLKSIEERKTAPRLPQMVFLETEVEHFEDSTIYLSDHPNADLAVDLLLGTQGWRRFAFINIKDFIALKGVMGERISAFHEGRPLKELYDEKIKSQPLYFDDEDDEEDGDQLFFDEGNFRERNIEFEDELFVTENENIQFSVLDMELPQVLEDQIFVAPSIEVAPKAKEMRKESPKLVVEEKIMMEPVEEMLMDEMAMLPIAPMLMEDFEFEEEQEERFFRPRPQPKNPALITRVFAFKKNPNRKAGERTNFVETLYWASDLKTNEEGETSFSFDLSDSVTSYRIMIGLFFFFFTIRRIL